MKHVKLRQLDKSFHNIIVNEITKENDNYLINYYDLVESKRKQALLKKENENFYIIEILKNRKDNFNYIENTNILPKTITYKNIDKEKISYKVFKSNYSYFINSNLCKKLNIAENNNKRIIKGIECQEVSKKDIYELEKKSKNTLTPNYVDVYEAKYSLNFNYYEKENKFYITRSILELIRNNNLEVEATPIILDNKNCYSITEKELSLFEKTTHYKGNKIKIVEKRPLVYHDKTNDELLEKTNNSTYIEINKEKLIKLINPIIISIYKNKKITKNITIYKYQDKNYISLEITNKYNLTLIYNEKIKILSSIYTRITNEELNKLIDNLKNNNIEVIMDTKKIQPKRR